MLFLASLLSAYAAHLLNLSSQICTTQVCFPWADSVKLNWASNDWPYSYLSCASIKVVCCLFFLFTLCDPPSLYTLLAAPFLFCVLPFWQTKKVFKYVHPLFFVLVGISPCFPLFLCCLLFPFTRSDPVFFLYTFNPYFGKLNKY